MYVLTVSAADPDPTALNKGVTIMLHIFFFLQICTLHTLLKISVIFYGVLSRDEDPEFFSTDPDPAQLIKNSGSDLKSK